jgi:hypothetical protein
MRIHTDAEQLGDVEASRFVKQLGEEVAVKVRELCEWSCAAVPPITPPSPTAAAEDCCTVGAFFAGSVGDVRCELLRYVEHFSCDGTSSKELSDGVTCNKVALRHWSLLPGMKLSV